MNSQRFNRLLIVLMIIAGVSVSAGLALYALKQNINLFYTPSQVALHQAPQHQTFRLGGLVRKGSLHHAKHHLESTFTLTDLHHDVTVTYKGILPDLFREGQGIVAQGHVIKGGVFVASEVLAKHDANYMPPEVAYALKQPAPAKPRLSRRYDGEKVKVKTYDS